VPCWDEEATVTDVVEGFSASLAGCVVYVYDNGSGDRTAARATTAGALVRTEVTPGKGGVVQRMFAEVVADIYVMADGDGTYDPAQAAVCGTHPASPHVGGIRLTPPSYTQWVLGGMLLAAGVVGSDAIHSAVGTGKSSLTASTAPRPPSASGRSGTASNRCAGASPRFADGTAGG
jgi:hypothetical protein